MNRATDNNVATPAASVQLEVSMQARSWICLVALVLGASYAAASHHNATLTVVTSVTEDISLPFGAGGGAETTITSTSAQPCPGGSNSVGATPGLVTQCQWSSLGPASTIKGKGTTVRAFLTTDRGEVFDISIFCRRQYGSCPEPKAGTSYAARLNDNPKYLADYAKRRVYGPIAVKFSPDGKKKVTYDIIFAMKAGSKQTHPD